MNVYNKSREDNEYVPQRPEVDHPDWEKQLLDKKHYANEYYNNKIKEIKALRKF